MEINRLFLIKKHKEVKNEIFDKKSIFGINIAGITSKLETTYINLF